MQAKKRKQRKKKKSKGSGTCGGNEHQNCICMAKSAGNAVDAILFGSRLCPGALAPGDPLRAYYGDGLEQLSQARRGGGA